MNIIRAGSFTFFSLETIIDVYQGLSIFYPRPRFKYNNNILRSLIWLACFPCFSPFSQFAFVFLELLFRFAFDVAGFPDFGLTFYLNVDWGEFVLCFVLGIPCYKKNSIIYCLPGLKCPKPRGEKKSMLDRTGYIYVYIYVYIYISVHI